MPMTKRLMSYFLAFQLAFLMPALTFAEATKAGEGKMVVNARQLRDDMTLIHFGKLDDENPWLTEFALGEPVTTNDELLWSVDPQNPLLDEDPFFLRSQSWQAEKGDTAECDPYCFSNTPEGFLNVHNKDVNKVFTIHHNFRVLLETDKWVFFKSADDKIFADKVVPGSEIGQGVFFINKKDMDQLAEHELPLPVFHFPLVESAWVGDRVTAVDLSVLGQIAFRSAAGDIQQVDIQDISLIERISRNNFTVAQVFAFLMNQLDGQGMALPLPKTTLGFGLILSGLNLPTAHQHETGFLQVLKDKFFSATQFIPKADADETKLDVMRRMMRSRLGEMALEEAQYLRPARAHGDFNPESNKSRWLPPALMYGGTALAAAGAATQIDFNALIMDGVGKRVAIVMGIFAATAVIGVVLKYTMHRKHFAKLYPPGATETQKETIHRHHKGIIDEFVAGLYFQMAAPGQTIRHFLDYIKDRVFAGNGMIQKAWEATVGFQMRQSQRLPVNWKTFYLGSLVMGMSDSLLVALDLLIFTPFLMQKFGVGTAIGPVAAAYATAEVLRNFIQYLQYGAHDYAMTVKMIHLKKAEKEARRQLEARGKKPDDPRNFQQLKTLTNEQLERTYVSLGLPTKESFLYDPITVLELAAQKSGFSLEAIGDLPAEEKAKLASQDFMLEHRYWGKIIPALKQALAVAEEAYRTHPSDSGLKVIATLKWALSYNSLLNGQVAMDVANKGAALASTDPLARKVLGACVRDEMNTVLEKYGELNLLGSTRAAVVGTLKYLLQPQLRDARDIRLTAFLMSTTGSYLDVMKYLPNSWLQRAGSAANGQVAAELFHRAFFALQNADLTQLRPTLEQHRAYGERAQKIVNRLKANDPAMQQDPFIEQIRHSETVARIALREREKFETTHFTPDDLTGQAGRQWQRARAQAQPTLDQMASETDFVVRAQWQSSAERFFALDGIDATPEKVSEWVRVNQRRLVLVSQFAGNLGLYVTDMESSEILNKVVAQAANETEAELQTRKNRGYLAKLDPAEREFYEARIFYSHFVSHYMNETVLNQDMSARSPEFPGRFQGMRIRFAEQKGWLGQSVVFFTRVAEAIYQIDAAAYLPGLRGSFNRDLPIIPDLANNFARSLRIMPYALTLGYMTLLIWTPMPYNMFVFSMALSFIHPVMVEINNRLMRYFDIRPMDDVPSKLTYSFIHSRLTNPIVMFEVAYAGAITAFLTTTNLAIGYVGAGVIVVGVAAYQVFRNRAEKKNFAARTEVRDGRLRIIGDGTAGGGFLRCSGVFGK